MCTLIKGNVKFKWIKGKIMHYKYFSLDLLGFASIGFIKFLAQLIANVAV